MKYSFTKSTLTVAGCLFVCLAAAIASAQGKISGGLGDLGKVATTPATTKHACTVSSVAVFSSRVHVLCANASGKIRFFAAATNDPAASMFIQIASQAKSVSQKITIEHSNKTAENPSGCQTDDCRKIVALSW